MKIDDATAFRLYLQCKSRASWVKCRKESPATEMTKVVAFGVPCDIDFGFFYSNNSAHPGISSCVWVFRDSGADFFGAFYLPVDEDAHAPAILNTTIEYAIENAKASQKFLAQQSAILSTMERVPRGMAASAIVPLQQHRNIGELRSHFPFAAAVAVPSASAASN